MGYLQGGLESLILRKYLKDFFLQLLFNIFIFDELKISFKDI